MERLYKIVRCATICGCLLLCVSSCGSSTSIYERERESKYEAAYEEGYKAGFNEGRQDGISRAQDSLNDTLHDIAFDSRDEWGISPEEAIALLDLYAEGESEPISDQELYNAIRSVYQYYWDSYYAMQEIDSYDG